jgi:hypothetical protein
MKAADRGLSASPALRKSQVSLMGDSIAEKVPDAVNLSHDVDITPKKVDVSMMSND